MLAATASILMASVTITASAQSESPFVRSKSVDGVTSFETATRSYRRADGTGATVSLVGVVHIGDRSYYADLVDVLDNHAIVLYESVLPRGAFGTSGDSDLDRQRRTQDAMLFLRGLIARFIDANDRAPQTMNELRGFIVGRDTRLARPIDLACSDGWGRALEYARDEGSDAAHRKYELISRGADGAVGGVGFDLDLVLSGQFLGAQSVMERDKKRPQKQDDKRDLYLELADALGVALQVRSIDYDRRGWEPADLPLEDLLDSLWKRGERSMTLEMLSNDSGLQQGVIRFLLSMVSKSPEFKKLVVQALGAGGKRGDSALGDVDARIIIDERNDAVIAQLKQLLASATPPKSVAIFYGAAHMPDFEASLRADFDLEPVDVLWHTAMSVDEWSVEKIEERLARFEENCASILRADPSGAYPEVARIDGRILSLKKRLATRSDSSSQH